MRLPAPSFPIAAACALAAVGATGCGGDRAGDKPVIGRSSNQSQAARALGFPTFATKNTTRVGGSDPAADAAGVAQAVYTGQLSTSRPPVVALANDRDWQGGIAAAVLMSVPLRAPLLLAGTDSVPTATRDTLNTLKPPGAKQAQGAQVIRVGSVANPGGRKTVSVTGPNPFALAAAIDRLHTRATGRASSNVIVASAERAEYAMPAAGLAAKSGTPVLYVTQNGVPAETQTALRLHRQPKIYLLGPSFVVSAKVERALKPLGSVHRVSGSDPITNAIALARYSDGAFGWGVVDPGHGLIFAGMDRPMDAAAAAPLSASGPYGPLLLVEPNGGLPTQLVQYLLDIQPGYERDPVRGVYNHGWLIGDTKAISASAQARIDTLLEIVPVTAAAPPAPKAPPKRPSQLSKTPPGAKKPSSTTRRAAPAGATSRSSRP